VWWAPAEAVARLAAIMQTIWCHMAGGEGPTHEVSPVRPAAVTIAVAGAGTDEIRSLYEWLLREDGLRGRVMVVHERGSAEEMGGVLGALAVALGSGGVLAVLARSLEAWLKQPRRVSVRLLIHGPDGSSIELEVQHAKDLGDVEGLLRRVMPPAALPESARDAPP
jgi:hypothetical protein